MKATMILLMCCVSPLAISAPKLPDTREFKGNPENMPPGELFKWALNAPVEDKPWRIVHKIEMRQKDPVEWGWNVNSALETALVEKYPKEMDRLVTVWQALIQSNGQTDLIEPGSVTATIFHLRITEGECGEVNPNDW